MRKLAAASDGTLERAIRAVRLEGESQPEALGPAARARILEAAAFLLTLHGADPLPPPDPGKAAPRVQVAKDGDQVRFMIANGGGGHTIYRSTAPNRFEAESGVTVTGGAFVDRLDDSAALVFYRIE
jgi:aminoglycoside phosphotransferase (APT) family kinase protein